jgi:hypothetical protein
VHSVTPIVAWIRRNIDSLIGRISLIADISINGKPILERQDRKHRRRLKMLPYNHFCDPWLTEIGSVSAASKDIIEKSPGQVAILLPPCPEG